MNTQNQAAREKEIFEQAIALAPAQARLGYVQGACRGDADLLARVQTLLRVHESAGGFLAEDPSGMMEPTLKSSPAAHHAEGTGAMIGRYKLLQKIGEGGCGSVYMAEQEQPVRRRVALKVIKLGMDTKEVIARFEAERQALAMMEHPNIAKVLDAGATETGRPFFVMELVRGIKITDYCDQQNLTTAERLKLFSQVCHAVQHAHQKGVIHRDLKPSNILVTVNDGVAVPKVIDFGIAKATLGRLTDSTLFTAFEQFIGTPAYMSPEQAELSSLDIDTRSDIYSLGVLLYELLTGRTPFESKDLMKVGLDEIRRQIREVEPPRPSARLSTLEKGTLSTTAEHRRTDAPKLIGLINGDLDWIVMRCLDKDRTRRYETATSLAQDLQRHLAHVPIVARPVTAAYRFRKMVRRNRLAVAGIAAVAAALVLGAVASTWQAVRASRAERTARSEAERASRAERTARNEAAMSEAVNDFLNNDLLSQAGGLRQARQGFTPEPNLTVRQALDRAANRIDSRFQDQPGVEAGIRHTIGTAYHELGDFEQSVSHLERAIALRKKTLGAEHPTTLKSLDNLASVYHAAGRRAEALPLFEGVLRVRKARLGADHPDTVTSMGSLARAYKAAGRQREALPLFEETFRLSKSTYGIEHPYTLSSMGHLASAYSNAQRQEEAIRLSMELVRLLQKTKSGPDLTDSLPTSGSLARFEETVQLKKSSFGADHPSTLDSMATLARVYRNAGRRSEALPLFEEILRLRKTKLGLDHPDTLASMNELAMAYTAAGRRSEALPLLEECLRLGRIKLGPDHPDTLTRMNNLGMAYTAAGRRAEALPLFEQSLRLGKITLGPDHIDTLNSMDRLAAAYDAADRQAEGVALREEALRLRKAKRGAELEKKSAAEAKSK